MTLSSPPRSFGEPAHDDLVKALSPRGSLGAIARIVRDDQLKAKPRLDLQILRRRDGRDIAAIFAGKTVVMRIERLRDGNFRFRMSSRGFWNETKWRPDRKKRTYKRSELQRRARRLSVDLSIYASLSNQSDVGNEAGVQAMLASNQHKSFALVAREPSIPAAGIGGLVSQIEDRLTALRSDDAPWLPTGGLGRTDERNRRPDALALDKAGRLLVIEAKYTAVQDPSDIGADVSRAPAQLLVATELLREWIGADPSSARNLIDQLAEQRRRLGLIPRDWRRIGKDLTVVPVVVVGGPFVEQLAPELKRRHQVVSGALTSIAPTAKEIRLATIAANGRFKWRRILLT